MASGGGSSSEPKVVRKVYKVNYRQAPGSDSQRRKTTKINQDQGKDTSIFELGNAFQSGNFDLDSFLNQMVDQGADVQTVGGDGKTIVTTTVKGSGPMIDIDGDGIPDVPAVQTKRIITIKRGDGSPTEEDDSREPGSPSHKPDNLVLPAIREIGGSYTPSSSTLNLHDGDTSPDSPASPTLPSHDDGTTPLSDANIKEKKAKFVLLIPKIAENDDDQSFSEERDDDDIITRGPNSFYLDMHDEDDDLLISSDEEDIQPRWHARLCLGRRRRIRKTTKVEMDKKGVRQGMTASDVTPPGEEAKLPAMQMMIISYNKMLEENPEEFRDTLFRAVKLNGLDVVRLLCRLASRKNIPLASDTMREPDSSATVLHVALLLDLPSIVEFLINNTDNDLLMATYTKEEYKNQTALHVAVANGNLKIIEMLLLALSKADRKTLMNTIADGTYFQREHPEGQLCVSSAAWSKNSNSLCLLAKYGASFAAPNLQGNTLLHCIVNSSVQDKSMDYQKLIDKVFEAVGVWAKHRKSKTLIPAQLKLEQEQKQKNTFYQLLELQNSDGVSPLILAAQLSSPLLLSLINMETIYKIPQTKLGSVAWVTYDVTDVSSYALGSYNKFSVLHVLAHNSKSLSETQDDGKGDSEEASTLDSEPIKTLVDGKWLVYRWIFYGWFIFHLLHMIAFSVVTARAAPQWKNISHHYENVPDVTVLSEKPNKLMALLAIVPSLYILSELFDLFGGYPYSIQFMYDKSLFSKFTKRLSTECVIVGNGPYRCVLFVHSISALAWLKHYLEGQETQLIPLSVSLLLGWIFLMFFTRGLSSTSRFSIMIQKMFFQDLMYFVAIFVLVMVAFTTSVMAMFSNVVRMRAGVANLMFAMLNIVVEIKDKDDIPLGSFPDFTQGLIICYTTIGVILMLNMLIAMMNTSYEAVRLTKENIWKQQQLSVLLMIERRLFWCRRVCLKSECKLWYKQWDHGTRAYIDVTTS